ncbi:MAG: AAA family ATPase [bacterium]
MTKQAVGTRLDLPALKSAVKQVNDYFDEIKKIYVGRDHVIDLIKYAMLQKSHLLFFGNPGTAKTAIGDSVFAGIASSTTFNVQLTAFMAEDGIFGAYNMKKIREEGVLEHNTAGMLPDANMANLDEFLDANPAVLRSMLSALNERRMIKGRQVLEMPLHIAYCSSNVDPFLFLRRNPQAWAVFDRIGFIGRIGYLEQADDVTEMVKRFQNRTSTTPKGRLELATLNSICDYVLMPPTLIQDELIYMKYGEAIIEYRKARKEKLGEFEQAATQSSKGEFDIDLQGMIFSDISDRRVCWGSQMIEVEAILNGRIQAEPVDMKAAHYILGTSEVEKQLWFGIIDKKIAEIEEMKKDKLSELQLQRLNSLKDQFESIIDNGHDLETRVNGVATLIHQMDQVHPENAKVKESFDALRSRIEEYRGKVSEELLKEKGLK